MATSIRSNLRVGLERECGRNVELVWLTGSLKPDFKTIADFRKDNGPAIRNVCRQFVALCRDINLLGSDSVAIDGSKFKAVNAKAKNFTREKLRKRFKEIDERIQRYLSELDRADDVHSATGMPVSDTQIKRVIDKIAWLKKEADKLAEVQAEMDRTGRQPDLGNRPRCTFYGDHQPASPCHWL